MKKLLLIFSLALLLVFSASAVTAASASPDSVTDNSQEQIYTATVTLQDIVVDTYSLLFKVALPNGGETELNASKSGFFLNTRGQLVSHDEFLRLYQDKTITIDFRELDPGVYVVKEARAGNK